MALKKCKACGTEVSKKAKTCPSCGEPQGPKEFSLGKLIVLIVFGFFMYSMFTGNSQDIKSASSSKVKVSSSAKSQFKSWALKNTAVTDLEYADNSDWKIWVRLSSDKYTTKKNVENIALKLANYYKSQTKYNSLVIVTVWDNQGNVVAKGKSY